MKIVSIKDPHFLFGFPNKTRVDYNNDIIDKLNWIKEYCLENDIKEIIFTGDILDISYSSKWLHKNYKLLKSILKKIFIDNGICLYTIFGNHDYFNGNNNRSDTILQDLIDDNIFIHLKLLEKSEVIFYGIDYNKDKQEILKELKRIDNIEIDKMKVVIWHTNVTDDESINFTDFTNKTINDFCGNIDCFICGHYHKYYPTQKRKITDTRIVPEIINQWSFARQVRTQDVKLNEHQPQICLLEINKDSLKSELINIPLKDYKEAFNPDTIDFIENKNFKFFDKIDLNNISEVEDDDILNIIIEDDSNDFTVEDKQRLLQYIG